jgi:hypothetical protein
MLLKYGNKPNKHDLYSYSNHHHPLHGLLTKGSERSRSKGILVLANGGKQNHWGIPVRSERRGTHSGGGHVSSAEEGGT